MSKMEDTGIIYETAYDFLKEGVNSDLKVKTLIIENNTMSLFLGNSCLDIRLKSAKYVYFRDIITHPDPIIDHSEEGILTPMEYTQLLLLFNNVTSCIPLKKDTNKESFLVRTQNKIRKEAIANKNYYEQFGEF